MDPEEEKRLPDCPVCGVARWSPRRRWTGLRLCGGCGTYLNDRSRSRLEEEARYLGAAVPSEGGDAGLAARRFEWVARLASEERNEGPISVLDIGCGVGAFLLAAREAGCRAAGVEVNPRAAEAGRRHGLDVTCGSVFDSGVPPGPWNVITFWDVLDQLERPQEALRLAARRLAPAGLLIVRGRNARVHAPVKMAALYVRRAAKAIPFPDPAVVHRWGLGPSGFRALLRAAGLADVRLHPDTLGRSFMLGPARLLSWASHERVYPFSSVLATARKPADRAASAPGGQDRP